MKLILKRKSETPTPPTPSKVSPLPSAKIKLAIRKPAKASPAVENCDGFFRAACTQTYSRAYVSYYLMASYLYYERHVSLLSDALYDDICKVLLRDFDKFDHDHMALLDRDLLAAGSGYSLDYRAFPTIVIAAANHLAHTQLGVDYPPRATR